MIQFMPANHSITNGVITILIKRFFKTFSLRCYVALLRMWRRRCFHGINAMILMPQIFDVTANENARYKCNELECSFSRGTVFCERTLWFECTIQKNKYTEEDIIKMLEFLVDNIFVVFAGKVFQQIIGIPMGTNCAPLLADIFLYSYEAEFIQSLLSAGKKRLASQFNFTYRYIDDVLSIKNPDFENYLGQMYPLSLRSKTRRRATLLLPTWICSCQSVGTVNFILPFTTNVTISISILQTFRSWVATSHLRPPMAFLSHNWSDTPGLATLMYVLFWGRCDFPISFSGRDMSRNVWNRL